MVKHKVGVTNKVADALSQKTNLLIAMQLEVSSFDSFQDLLDTILISYFGYCAYGRDDRFSCA